ncbi:MAG: hypothetical protein U5K76_06555 [Woeseiaceae bacterium]|nr:hypothetical protein [Woeseiaceae bacterium]
MRTLASWLVARPWNSVLGLSLTLLLPFAPMLSGAVLVLLVLANGAQRAILQAAAAAALLSGLMFAFGDPVPLLLVDAASAWVPALLLALLLAGTRSLTLSLQVSVIVAALATLGFFVAVGDPIAFWESRLAELAGAFEEMGFSEESGLLTAQADKIAPQMTMLFVFLTWSMSALVLVLGYGLYQQLPEKKGTLGRFSDLHFGRVLALVMAVVSLLALVTNVAWIESLAFVMFAVFWLQGAALVHWLHTDGPLPVMAVVAIYALLPILNLLLVTVLAVVGYTDAWFNYRPRIAARRAASRDG